MPLTIIKIKFTQMKKLNLLLLLMLSFGALFAQEKSTLIIGKLVQVVPAMKDLKPVDESKLIRAYDEKGNRIWPQGKPDPKPVIAEEPVPEGYTDPMIQKMDQAANGNITPDLTSSIIAGIEGQATGIRVFDPTICVGSNHVIQLVNGTNGATMQIWTKDGTTAIAPISLQALSGLPPGGDPIALYDQLADRYILTQFITGNGSTELSGMAILVSQTSDPTLGWFSYRWTIPENFLLDYPKWAVGPTGLFLHTNNFVLPKLTNFTSSFFAAFNKTDMYNGSSTFRSLRINQAGGKNKSTCPAQVQGNGAVEGGQFFVSLVSLGLLSSGISVTECIADWNSNTLTQRTVQNIATSYQSNVCSASDDVCVQQLNSSVRVEVLSGRIMNQPIIRVLPNGQTGIVFCHSINTSNGRAGIRWAELRRSGTGWSIFQQSTWHPNGDHHFMGSMAYDANGNIGLGYNTGGPGRYLGVSYTARRACDPLNQMTLPETSLRDGTAATDNTRWGDYSHMVADPDGQSVWMTAMYGRAGAAGGRGSYISRIILPSCGETCLPPSSLSANNVTGSDAQLTWSAVPSAVSYTVEFKPAAFANWVAAGTTTANTISISSLAAATTYDWRVMSNCSFGSSIFSAAQFTTAATGGTCAAPAGLTMGQPECFEATVAWNIVPGAASYRVEYKRNTSTIWTVGTTATTNNSYVIFATGGSYNWRVQANCSGTVSEFANSTFGILTGTQCNQRIVQADVKKSDEKISVSPQPSDNELVASFSASQSSPVIAEFINQQGVVVQRNTATAIKGTNAIRLNVSKLAAGTYILRLNLRGKIVTTKVVIE
jgi:Secretion system C-terminal sorting domain